MVRAFIAALMSIVLAGCTREAATGPFAESQAPPGLAPRFLAPEGWAWGYVKAGARPAQRYGVASTWRAPRAAVVILPGYGETAETWFETASGLTAEGYTVWVLDRAGQGGSGRYTLPRDLGFTPSFDDDVAGLKALVKVAIRPRPGVPLVVLGHADGAVVVLRAVEQGLGVDGVIASSPRLAPHLIDPSLAHDLAGKLPLVGRLPTPEWRPWTRADPDDRQRGDTHDYWRGGVTHAWQTANPDLRMAGPSQGWRGAFLTASTTARLQAPDLHAPVLWLTAGDGEADQAALCRALPDCRAVAIAGARPALHLEAAAWRTPWFAAVSDFLAARVARARAVKGAETPEKVPLGSGHDDAAREMW